MQSLPSISIHAENALSASTDVASDTRSNVELSEMPVHTRDNQMVNHHTGQVGIIGRPIWPPADRVGTLGRQDRFHPKVSVQLVICIVVIFTVKISDNSCRFIRLMHIDQISHSSKHKQDKAHSAMTRTYVKPPEQVLRVLLAPTLACSL